MRVSALKSRQHKCARCGTSLPLLAAVVASLPTSSAYCGAGVNLHSLSCSLAASRSLTLSLSLSIFLSLCRALLEWKIELSHFIHVLWPDFPWFAGKLNVYACVGVRISVGVATCPHCALPSPCRRSHHTLWWVRSRLPWATTRFFQDSTVLWWEIVARSWVLFSSCAALLCSALPDRLSFSLRALLLGIKVVGVGRGRLDVCGVWVAVRPSTLLPRWNAVGETSKLHLPTAKRCERFSWVFSSIFQATKTSEHFFQYYFSLPESTRHTCKGNKRRKRRKQLPKIKTKRRIQKQNKSK